jgi:HEPN domain-containing protein
MTPPINEEAETLLKVAERDMAAFRALIENPRVHDSISFFHAQQYVEKALKAALVIRGVEIRRMHDLTELAALLRDKGMVLPVDDDDLARLNPFAVTFRYSDPEITVITKEEASSIIDSIERWVNALRR